MAEDTGFKNTIKQEFGKVTDSVKAGFANVGGMVKSSMSDVIGPQISQIAGSVVGMGKSLKDSLFNILKGEKTSKADKERNGILIDTYNAMIGQFKKEEKRAQLLKPGKKRSLGDKMLLGIVVALGLAIGAVIRKFILPFELLFKTMKGFFRFFKFLGRWMTSSLPLFKTVKDGPKLFAKIGKLWKFILKKIPFLGAFFRSLATGFKMLGWPLTIILGVIDFIKGFVGTEGTLAEKIKAGLMGAIQGFIELPVKFIGWIIDKVLGFIGLQVEGGAGAAIMGKIMGFFSVVTDWISVAIVFWGGLFSTIGGHIKGFADMMVNDFGGFFIQIWDEIGGMIDAVRNWLQKYIGKFASWLGIDIKEVSMSPTSSIDAIKSDKMTTSKTMGMKREEQRKADAEARMKSGDAQRKATDAQTNVITQVVSQQGAAAPVEIPSGTDNYLLTLGAMGF